MKTEVAGNGKEAQGGLDRATIEKAYARWAPVYDLVFGPLLDMGRRTATTAATRVGGRILNVGVGTGLELPYFEKSHEVIGVDISEPMLRKAQERVDREKLQNVKGLCVMDGANLSFADGSFDCVVAQFVITTVPQPEKTLDEFARVLKPGGEIVLVNHIGAERGLRASFERWFSQHARKLGWSPEFPFKRLSDWAEKNGNVRLVERRTVPPFGVFTLMRFARQAAASAKPAAATA
ncbi:MAG: class I SAM-dependent methyltransferase [Xanthobacteraceae bacterium]|jgi:phosphatidylethanolamine/phosphatidyl-N-methylethanolamine N-methyltransferase|nr:class I SAM-dependent methyltransferase [Xanthobacteraceae bacterium]